MGDNVLLVDTSYVVFAKYYSTLSWYLAEVNPKPDFETIVADPVFAAKYESSFNSCIARIAHYRGVALCDIAFAKDCSKDTVWRRSLHSSYKSTRAHNSHFNREIFGLTYISILPAWIQRHGGAFVGAEGAEADDVLASMARVFHQYTPRRVIILSNDNDCIQLINDRTMVVNLLNQDVGRRRGDLTPAQYLTCRLICGDRSDNIPGAVPKCGMKTAVRIVTGEVVVPVDAERMQQNDALMNLGNIPPEVSGRVLRSVLANAANLIGERAAHLIMKEECESLGDTRPPVAVAAAVTVSDRTEPKDPPPKEQSDSSSVSTPTDSSRQEPSSSSPDAEPDDTREAGGDGASSGGRSHISLPDTSAAAPSASGPSPAKPARGNRPPTPGPRFVPSHRSPGFSSGAASGVSSLLSAFAFVDIDPPPDETAAA